MKHRITEELCWNIKAMGIPKLRACRIGFDWIEPDKRRDMDNISAGKKFILDALVWAGVIADDSWKCVKGFMPESFRVIKDNPGVWVYIKEVE